MTQNIGLSYEPNPQKPDVLDVILMFEGRHLVMPLQGEDLDASFAQFVHAYFNVRLGAIPHAAQLLEQIEQFTKGA